MDIYSRLNKYHETPFASATENFLTEAFTDLFNRLPLPTRIDLLAWMLPRSWAGRFRRECDGANRIEARTQVSIVAAGSVKRPDMVVHRDGKPIILLEVKVYAPFQAHRLEAQSSRGSAEDPVEVIYQGQLKTYSEWISSKNVDDWPGAVILLTHQTQAPAGFEDDGRSGKFAVSATRTWREIGSWLASNLDLSRSDATHCALASDFRHFLKRQGLMTDFVSSRDLAATEMFLPAYGALQHTFRTLISEVASKYKKSKGGNFHLEFWSEGQAYWAWYYLNGKLNPVGAKYYVGIGLCFPGQTALGFDEAPGLPKHEPFFFVMISNGWANEAPRLLSQAPKGWLEFDDDCHTAVVTRAVSQFDADPDARTQMLISWAQAEFGKAVANVPGYEAASIENVREDSEA